MGKRKQEKNASMKGLKRRKGAFLGSECYWVDDPSYLTQKMYVLCDRMDCLR